MTFTRALVTIPSDTGESSDTISNTWYFDSDTDDHSLIGSHIVDKLETFYQVIDNYLAGNLLASPATVKLYDMEDAVPRVPYLTDTIVLTLGAGLTPMPSEVAMVMSFRAAAASGANPRRRRGRVYLGPFNNTTIINSGGRVLWDATVAGVILAGAVAMRDLVTTDNSKWAIYSPTTFASTGSYAASFNDVSTIYIDNAPDTQRRRGTKPTTRYQNGA